MSLPARLAALHDRLETLTGEESARAVARRVGVSHQTVAQWRARATHPDTRALILISDAYSVSLDWLVMGVRTSFPVTPAGDAS
ncbi:MAG: helix-turn-helix domain-containing protein [Paracoccaceae bacterium]